MSSMQHRCGATRSSLSLSHFGNFLISPLPREREGRKARKRASAGRERARAPDKRAGGHASTCSTAEAHRGARSARMRLKRVGVHPCEARQQSGSAAGQRQAPRIGPCP